MTAGLPRSRISASARTPPVARISAVLETVSVECFGFGEVMTATSNFASVRTSADAGDTAAPATSAGPFVLNLCSSTTPMALTQTDLPELKRFTFFVSRRFEEGRERFRLHMGYFATLAEAEEWLSVVREIYPGGGGRQSPGPQAARACRSSGRRSGPACRRTSAAGRAGACARPRSRTR